MTLEHNGGISREQADWLYRSRFDFGNADTFVLNLSVRPLNQDVPLFGKGHIDWLKRSTTTPIFSTKDGRAALSEPPSIEVAVGVSGQGSDDVSRWFEAASIFGTKLNQSRIGYLAMPEDYEASPVPPQSSCIVEGAERWVLAMHELRSGPWAWQESELSWVCNDPVQTSHDLVDALMLVSLDKTHEERQTPTLQQHRPPPQSAMNREVFTDPVGLEPDDVLVLLAADSIGARMEYVSSNKVHRKAFPKLEGSMPRNQRDRLKTLGLITTKNGGGFILTGKGIHVIETQLAHK